MTAGVVLIGPRGAGKSACGPALARILDAEFSDLDRRVEQAAGASIADIWRREGEAGFRERERRAARALAEEAAAGHRPRVVAAGGGAILDPDTLAALRMIGTLVLLTAAPSVLQARLAADETARPPLHGDDPVAEVDAVVAERDRAYRAAAAVVIPTDNLAPDDVARAVAAAVDGGSR